MYKLCIMIFNLNLKDVYERRKKFREALKEESPLQIVGTINAYQALQATKSRT